MNKQAADAFLLWLNENSPRISSICDEMQSAEIQSLAPQKKIAKLQNLFVSIEKEIGPRLAEIEDGLQFEVGGGEKKRHALIISAGGISNLVEAVRYIALQAPDLSDLEIVAFKPARPLPETAKQIIETRSGRKEIGPGDVFFSLKSELTKVGVQLYFKDFQIDEYQIWGQVGFNFMDFALGEYRVMESVGEVVLQPISETIGEIYPVTQLAELFEAERSKVVANYHARKGQAAEERFSSTLIELSEEIQKLEESLKHTDTGEEAYVSVTVWSEDLKVLDLLKQRLAGFDFDYAPKFSAVGAGYLIEGSGAIPKHNLSIHRWLSESIAPALVENGFVTGICEQQVPGVKMALMVGSSLLKQDRIEEAIKLLKVVLGRHRQTDDGMLHGLLGMAYLKANRNEEATEIYESGLQLTRDVDIRGEMFTNRGCALKHLGRMEEAIASFNEALMLDGKKFSRHYNLACTYSLIGDVAKACAHLEKSLELKPDLLEHVRTDIDLDSIRNTESYTQVIATCESKPKGIAGALRKGLKSLFS